MLTLGTPLAMALGDLSSAEPAEFLRTVRLAVVRFDLDSDLTEARRRAEVAAADACAAATEAAAAARTIAAAAPFADSTKPGWSAARAQQAVFACLTIAAEATLAAEQALAAARLAAVANIPLEQHPCSRATQVPTF